MDILRELVGLPAQQLFTLTVLGALISTVGSLIGSILKDFLFARSLESWKSKRSLLSVYRRYRDPIILSSIELLNRIQEIVYQTPVNFLSSELMTCETPKMSQNSAEDPYYRKYKLVSTVYRLCAWLGWLELYRQEVTFLDSGKNRANRAIEDRIAKIRGDLADGHLNDAEDWELWSDVLFLREEQRAVGEAMISVSDGAKSILGYGTFNQVLLGSSDDHRKQWLGVASSFILDLNVDSEQKDFRRVRCLRLIEHLIDLIEVLDKKRVKPEYVALRIRAKSELKNYAVLQE